MSTLFLLCAAAALFASFVLGYFIFSSLGKKQLSQKGAPKSDSEEEALEQKRMRMGLTRQTSATTSGSASEYKDRPTLEVVGETLGADDEKRKAEKTGGPELTLFTSGLKPSREGFMGKLRALVSRKQEIDPSILSEIEEVLLTGDVGIRAAETMLARLKDKLKKNELGDAESVWSALREEAKKIVCIDRAGEPISITRSPTVVLMVGVNGVGKTTTIGKLAAHFQDRSLMLAAGDTFRAAAVAQLEIWGNRVSAKVFKGKEGADPGSVAFEATTKAKELGTELLLVDSAGRLHNKVHLMDEIRKIHRTIAKVLPGAPHETLLVLDATTGQNAIHQAALFQEAVPITGIVLTKLDGTAKGGVVLGICEALRLPVRYVGLGEKAEDLKRFDPDKFIDALFLTESN